MPLLSLPQCTFHRLSPPLSSKISLKSSRFRIVASSAFDGDQHQPITIQRRSANYKPSIWDYNYIQSINCNNADESAKKRAEKLKEEARTMMVGKVVDPLHQVELIDVLERLGLSYHFENEIEIMLATIYNNIGHSSTSDNMDLHAVALEFRLLRQHGYHVPQGVFDRFTDESGNFKTCLCENTKGMLSLYEASYVMVEGESVLEKARDFTTRHLRDYVNNYHEEDDEGHQEPSLSDIRHALEFPQHWRVRRVESRWFIDAYEKRHDDKNHVLLELAKLDFNMVQAIHREDLKDRSRWWKEIGIAQKLSFSRDRLMENFLWTVAFAHEPKFQYFRRMTTEIYALITTVDDVYDVYGTLDELNLFTNAIERWDLSAMDQLPDYMKLCFLAVFNSTNKLAYDVLNKHGIDVIYYLKKSWVDLCKAYLLEAEWYYIGYKPSLEEYIENSWMSVGVPAVLVHVYFSVTNQITEEALKGLEDYHHLIRCSALILRLEDDIGTSPDEQERGDIPKSIQLFMHETGGSEEDARKYARDLVKGTWTKMNTSTTEGCPFPREYVSVALNVARMSQHMYQYGDGHASQNQASKDRILSLLINPIPLIST